MVPVLGTISQVMVTVLHSGTQQREQIGLVVCVADVRFSCMSSVLSPPPPLLITLKDPLCEKSLRPQQVLAFSVIRILLKATTGFIFSLTHIGNCAAGTGSHFTSVGSASGLLALLSPHSSPAYYPLWLVEVAESAQEVLTHLSAPLRLLQSLCTSLSRSETRILLQRSHLISWPVSCDVIHICAAK